MASRNQKRVFRRRDFAMVGTSREHNQIAENLSKVLGNHLLEKPYSIYSKRENCFSEIT